MHIFQFCFLQIFTVLVTKDETQKLILPNSISVLNLRELTLTVLAGISERVSQTELLSAFNKYGRVKDVKIVTNGFRNKGYAFVRYETPEEAEKAIAEAHEKLELGMCGLLSS